MFVFLINNAISFCQSSIKINYLSTSLNFIHHDTYNSHIHVIPNAIRVLIGDSFQLLKMDNRFYAIGDKRISFTDFSDFRKPERFQMVKWPKGPAFFVMDSIYSWNWKFPDAEKKILHKHCKAALSVGKNNDSVLVWYTNDLIFQKGGLWYDSIPGVILEVYDQKRNCHIIATKIKAKKTKITYPAERTRVSHQQWFAMIKKVNGQAFPFHEVR